jgi:hypothetical protein
VNKYQGGSIGLIRLTIALLFSGSVVQTSAPIIDKQAVQEPVVSQQQVQKPEQPKPKPERTAKPKQVEQKPAPVPEAIPEPVPATPPVAIPQDKTELMRLAGIPQTDWTYVDSIITRESGWQHLVWNGTGSGAYGLCQSLPATKMASAGADYMTNPVTQLKWCHSYALGRYGSWLEAYNFWNVNHWW